MKAKSWKKFVSKKERSDSDSNESESLFEGGNKQKRDQEPDLFQAALEENERLRKLYQERRQLEQKMASITGQETGGDLFDSSRIGMGEIKGIAEKRKEEALWEAQRKRLQRRKKKDEEGSGAELFTTPGPEDPIPPVRSNATSADPVQAFSPDDLIGKVRRKAPTKEDVFEQLDRRRKSAGKKNDEELEIRSPSISKSKEEDDISRSKRDSEEDDLDARREKARKRAKQLKSGYDQFKGGLDKLDSQLNEFKKEGADFGDDDKFMSEVGNLKDRFGTDSKLDKSLNKMTDTFNKKRGGEKLDQKWDELRKKKRKLKKKDSYEERKKRLLNVDRETLEEFDERRRLAREKRNKEKQEEKRKEEREREKEEERKEQRLAEQKEEEREEQKKEDRKAERKRAAKEDRFQ